MRRCGTVRWRGATLARAEAIRHFARRERCVSQSLPQSILVGKGGPSMSPGGAVAAPVSYHWPLSAVCALGLRVPFK
jgi:hypothetical protein